jgi:phosphoserine phosphatase
LLKEERTVLKLAVFDLDGTLKQARDPYVYLTSGWGWLRKGKR